MQKFMSFTNGNEITANILCSVLCQLEVCAMIWCQAVEEQALLELVLRMTKIYYHGQSFVTFLSFEVIFQLIF